MDFVLSGSLPLSKLTLCVFTVLLTDIANKLLSVFLTSHMKSHSVCYIIIIIIIINEKI